jgi:hypothetical protein
MSFGSTPRQDPRVGEASMAQAETGRRMADLAEQEFAYNKEMLDRFAPVYEALIKSSVRESNLNSERAADQWDQYQSVFRPIENRMAEEAMTYDSPEELARREGLAAATVARQFDASTGQMNREMARMGVSPTSSLGAQGLVDQANARALARAGAVNKERNDTKLLGMSLRQDAARFGRNQTGTGLAASAAALQGSQAAGGLMGSQLQQGQSAAQSAISGMGAGAGQMGSAANTLLNQWQANVNAQSQNNAGLGSLVGTGLMAGAMLMPWSSEKVKDDVRPVDDEEALLGLEQVAVKDWKYKDGVADGGRHTGPIAEDMQEQFGDTVAPEGQALDLISVSGKHHAAIRALAKRGKKLEARVQRLEKAGGAGLADLIEPAQVGEGRLPPVLAGDMGAGAVGLQDALVGVGA